MRKKENVDYILEKGLKNKGLKFFEQKHPEILEDIINFNINFKNISFTQMKYNYINNIKENPKCLNCNHDVKFTTSKGSCYNKYCSVICSNKSNTKKEIIKKKNIEKYGHSCSLKNKDIIKKAKQTKKIRYGDENYSNRRKAKQTHLNRYGFYNNNKTKARQTNLIKNGYEYFDRDKIKQIKKIKYGDENYNNRRKAKETLLKKHGFYNNNRTKAKETLLKKYNVDHYSKTELFKQNIVQKHNTKTQNKWCNILGINIDDFIINKDIITIKNYCDIHNNFEIDNKNFYNRILNNIPLCTKCYPINEQKSTIENEMLKEIKKFYDGDIYLNDRKILNGFEIDIYIPEFNLGIEINGLFWHSNLFKDKKYHKNKTDIAIKKGVFLFQFFDDEWLKNKQLILSMIKNKMNIIENKIYGRKCVVNFISNKDYVNFLQNNHIQGKNNAKYKLGLFFNNRLFAVMGFEKTRKTISNIDDSYTLNRFCNEQNTIVIGGANKLLNFFIKNLNPKEIITFADKRYSYGDLYYKLGFNKVKDVDESYYVFHKNEYIRKHRFFYNKKKLIQMGYDSNKTENEILKENNFLKIYDSGKIKFKLDC